jgi:hypothetical protein
MCAMYAARNTLFSVVKFLHVEVQYEFHEPSLTYDDLG